MFVKVASKIMIMVHFVCLATTLIKTKSARQRHIIGNTDKYSPILNTFSLTNLAKRIS